MIVMNIEKKQCLLKYLDYYEGKVDGISGSKTEAAVQAFREDNGMPKIGDEFDEVLVGAVFHGKFKSKNTATNNDTWADVKYFRKEEFACKCGGKYCNGYPAEADKTLLTVADRVREHFGKAIHVSSGIRCKQHNANVGGVSGSRHLTGKAMDFRVIGYTARQVLVYVQQQPEIRYAYAIDGTYVHMDVN
jgi:hypothetical protein